jgi:hypothetical protein
MLGICLLPEGRYGGGMATLQLHEVTGCVCAQREQL